MNWVLDRRVALVSKRDRFKVVGGPTATLCALSEVVQSHGSLATRSLDFFLHMNV